MEPIKVLILTANPSNTGSDPLRLEAEARRIKEAFLRSHHRDRFEVNIQPATRPIDLRHALREYKPHIVHFSGHGMGEQGLVLENDAGKVQLVSTDALTTLFSIFETGEIECVLLNACYSEEQATAIHQFVDCVIGMNQPIGDKSAIQFAEGFYDALGAGDDYETAFKIGCSAIALEGSSEYITPVLKNRKRRGVSRFEDQPQGQALQSERESMAIVDPPPMNPDTSMPPSDGVKEPAQPAQAQASQVQSPTFGNISIGGNVSDSNMFTFNQAGGNLQSDQSRTSIAAQNTDLKMILDQLQQLKRAVDTAPDLEADDKAETQTRIKLLEDEIQKPEPKKDLIDRVVTKLKKGLEGVETLAEPVLKVASLVAKVWGL